MINLALITVSVRPPLKCACAIMHHSCFIVLHFERNTRFFLSDDGTAFDVEKYFKFMYSLVKKQISQNQKLDNPHPIQQRCYVKYSHKQKVTQSSRAALFKLN